MSWFTKELIDVHGCEVLAEIQLDTQGWLYYAAVKTAAGYRSVAHVVLTGQGPKIVFGEYEALVYLLNEWESKRDRAQGIVTKLTQINDIGRNRDSSGRIYFVPKT